MLPPRLWDGRALASGAAALRGAEPVSARRLRHTGNRAVPRTG